MNQPSKHTNARSLHIRLLILLVIGLMLLGLAEIYRSSKRPAPAPALVQETGRKKILNILEAVAKTKFGQSDRGKRIARKIRSLLARRKIIFTAEIRAQGLYRAESLGPDYLYVKVLRTKINQFIHQSDDFVAEAIFHEAVHALRDDPASIEEECDGYAAGLTAGNILRGTPTQFPITIDGKPVAQFVRRAYPKVPRNARYQPVGIPLSQLTKITGLESNSKFRE